MNLSGDSEIFYALSNSSREGAWESGLSSHGLDLCEDDEDTIFDKAYVRAILITLYSLVFCFCFFGNLAVVLVVTLHWKMRSITKFCIGNLAFANFCVGIFCVYQNLTTFLIDRWVFGSFMCKMYHFINSLSHTTSIFILIVICVERYLAVLHPFKSRKWITITKLKVAIVTVWILSAIICSPRLYYFNLIYFPVSGPGGKLLRYDAMCAPQHSLYNAPIVDMSYFILLFILPLLVISILYTKICIVVWRGSRFFRNHPQKGSYSSQNETLLLNQNFKGYSRKSRRRRAVRFSSTFEENLNLKEISRMETIENEISISEDTSGSVFSGSPEPPTKKCHSRLKLTVRLNIFRQSVSKKRDLKSKLNSCFHKNVTGNSCENRQTYNEVLTENFPRPRISNLNNNDQHFASSALVDFPRRKVSKQTCILNSSKILHRKFSRRKVTRQFSNSSVGRTGGRSLRPRKAVVRMMIVVVVTFALCNLPFHIRKICISYIPDYEIGSTFSNLLAPMTFLMMYANCAINPIIYAFMSKEFRKSFLDLVKCQLRRNFLHHRDSNTAILNVVHNVV